MPDSDLALETRKKLPADLEFLLQKYPKQVWANHQNLGEASQFWLQRHDMFRDLSTGLIDSANLFKDAKQSPQEFQAWFTPRFWFFLQQLDSHHRVEEMHYFPLLIRAENKLKSGFELLEADHKVIHAGLLTLQDTGIKLDHALREDPTRVYFAADDVAGSLTKFLGLLTRHLSDEEDLIIPLVLDRGELTLGMA